GDELRIEQILINIISNAIKYTPEGRTVDLLVEETGPGRPGFNRYRFVIRDTGIGISEEYLPHIFDSFTREQNTTINRIQGTGLGLAITARAVEMMGGTINVESRVGEGSTFTVELELEESEKSAGAEQEAPDPAQILGGRRILLVEDNDINAEIAQMILSQFGVVCERAADGQQGAEKMRAFAGGKGERFAAVLMDIQMPVMNGYESSRAIRAMEEESGDAYFRMVPILAMSANAYDEDVRACLDAGMNAHIAKPFQPDALLKLLCELIE
ncbi:MAG: response regulator, partial [Lachnospiraceae bacterium]|nr:response regulator [Lachnospiraceae bacterium]